MRSAMRTMTMLTLASLLLGFTKPIQAQEGIQNPEFQQKLNGLFTLTKLTADGSDIVTPGSVLVLERDGLMMSSVDAKVPLPNSYKSGIISNGFKAKMKWRVAEEVEQAGLDVSGVQWRTFVTGEKLWILAVNVQNDGVLLKFYSDPYNDVRYHGDVKIQFSKGSSQTEDALRMIAEVVTVDDAAQAVQPIIPLTPATVSLEPQQTFSDLLPPPPSAPDAPVASPATVSMGQSKAEVRAILGQPKTVARVGDKEIDYYPDMKVIFIFGKVKDIQ